MRELFATIVDQDEAHILNVCSMFGMPPYRKPSVYQTSKFNLVESTLVSRGEYLRSDVGIIVLCFGFVRTSFLDHSGLVRTHLRKMLPRMTAAKVLEAGWRGFRSGQGIVIPGQGNRLLIGGQIDANRHCPLGWFNAYSTKGRTRCLIPQKNLVVLGVFRAAF